VSSKNPKPKLPANLRNVDPVMSSSTTWEDFFNSDFVTFVDNIKGVLHFTALNKTDYLIFPNGLIVTVFVKLGEVLDSLRRTGTALLQHTAPTFNGTEIENEHRTLRVCWWLQSCYRESAFPPDPKPVRVVINKQTFYGAIYCITTNSTVISPDGKPYRSYCMCLLGRQTSQMLKRSRHCLQYDLQRREPLEPGIIASTDWYCSTYIIDQNRRRNAIGPYTSPFGENFIYRLHVPVRPGDTLDEPGQKPHTRIPMTVEFLPYPV